MSAELDDIVTPRLALRLMDREIIEACLSDDLARARALLGVAIPPELAEASSSLEYGLRQLNEDPLYLPWSARAMVLTRERKMIGVIRFHSRPDPGYLRPYARNAVEFGYRVFTAYRRSGYAREAVGAAMAWAQARFGVHHFVASVSPGNAPSLRLLARFGFAKVGEEMDETDGLEHVFLRQARAD